jgi:hypothetical protein
MKNVVRMFARDLVIDAAEVRAVSVYPVTLETLEFNNDLENAVVLLKDGAELIVSPRAARALIEEIGTRG